MRPSQLLTDLAGQPGQIPYDGIPFHLSGSVLFHDEREWLQVLATPAVRDPWQTLVNLMLDWSFEIQPARAGVKSSEELARVARVLFGGINEWGAIYKALALGHFIGWSPVRFEIGEIYDAEARRWLLAPVAAVAPFQDVLTGMPRGARVPVWWEKRGSRNSAGLVIRYRSQSGAIETMGPDQWPTYWAIARRGVGASPYGSPELAIACHPVARLAASTLSKSTESVDGAFGTMILTVPEPKLGNQQKKTADQVRESVEVATAFRPSKGLLVEIGEAKLRTEAGGNSGPAGIAYITNQDLKLRRLICGSELSATTTGSGPAGSSKSQDKTALGYAKELAVSTVAPALCDFFCAMLRLNGYRVEENEAPVFTHGLVSWVSHEVVTTLIQAKVPISGVRLARALGGESAVNLIATDQDIASAGEAEDFVINRPGAPPAELPAANFGTAAGQSATAEPATATVPEMEAAA
jgi:hypothetical protein